MKFDKEFKGYSFYMPKTPTFDKGLYTIVDAGVDRDCVVVRNTDGVDRYLSHDNLAMHLVYDAENVPPHIKKKAEDILKFYLNGGSITKEQMSKESTKMEEKNTKLPDAVNHPSHYTWLKDLCGIEVIDITRHMDFDLGNAVKYILRQGKKPKDRQLSLNFNTEEEEKAVEESLRQGAIQDLKKAIWYINDKIRMLENGIG